MRTLSRFMRRLGALSLAWSSVAAAQRSPASPAVFDFKPYAGDPKGKVQRVTVGVAGAPGHRTFELTTTAPQRAGDPQRRSFTEVAGSPFVVTGNALFDALFAQAIDDARQASVDRIKDGSYNDDMPIDCRCFETGEKWHYVWTRDLAYALDLGLASIDPDRAVASLLFKTSGFRAGVPVPAELPEGSSQTIEDTGSGGSWPVSTDRAVWALGAERTLGALTGPARSAFARKAYDALRGTVEADRVAAYDPRDGLYGGEHSFLDWREQTYAPWIVDALPMMAQSKALSTNIVQLRALRLAARLGRELGDSAAAARYASWGEALVPAIDRAFWDPSASLYATFTTADRFPARIAKYDLLGNALAILAGIPSTDRAKVILSSYPFAPFGPPVVWPQAPGEYVYHNRAIWPFVTAYALRAAAESRHVAAADNALASLMRGASLHLSNMENLEWLTGQSQFDDGPAINSRRQLWSIGAYIGAVTSTVFGFHGELDRARIAPFLTSDTRALFGASGSATLSGLTWHGKALEIVLALPPAAPHGAVYDVKDITLNGKPTTGGIVDGDLGAGRNRIVVRFGEARHAPDVVRTVPQVSPLSHDDPRVFMPWTPRVVAERDENDAVSLTLSSRNEGRTIAYRILREGRTVSDSVTTSTWHDPSPPEPTATVCYSAIARDVENGLASQPSAPSCVDGTGAYVIAVSDPRVTGGDFVPPGDGVAQPTRRIRLGATLSVRDIEITQAGRYSIALEYDNHVFALNTGVTNAVKRVTITGDNGERHQGIVQMPHVRPIDGKHPIRQSTRIYVTLAPGRYGLALTDFFNMSMLASNATYSGPGGKAGPVNEARIAAILIDRLTEER